ncbi:LLM class flavin-dependent oxidoreductase [Tomitella biformata]|uniref:LLM class flavin-dependent oxidoreductase n=1 Tax=Tomitella biformata TaxID=630403 RepID=UPI0004632527|nr:LLM class flavin-dependent oxidoreductase [Tomitella biformata]
MADYGRELQFGYFLTPTAADPAAVLRSGILCDELGFDLIGVQDHPYQRRFLDAWTLLSVLGARTTRVALFPDVASLPLRTPAMLAKAAASLDVLTGGRVELGLGAGAFWDAIAAMGGPRRTPGEAVGALTDAIEVLRLMWSDERAVSHDGEFYSLAGVHPGPAPAHPIGIWIGGYKPRMLRLVGVQADGWLPSLGYIDHKGIAEASARIDDAAGEAGREPSAIRRILNINGKAETAELVRLCAGLAVEHGIDTFVLDAADDDELRRLAGEVIPAIRRQVAENRGGAAAL